MAAAKKENKNIEYELYINLNYLHLAVFSTSVSNNCLPDGVDRCQLLDAGSRLWLGLADLRLPSQSQ